MKLKIALDNCWLCKLFEKAKHKLKAAMVLFAQWGKNTVAQKVNQDLSDDNEILNYIIPYMLIVHLIGHMDA